MTIFGLKMYLFNSVEHCFIGYIFSGYANNSVINDMPCS